MNQKNIGFAICGSFCTFEQILPVIEGLIQQGANVTPIVSFHAGSLDTRFGEAKAMRARLEAICQNPLIDSIEKAEPIGPQRLFDALVVAPCTGNTLSKLAAGIADTPVTMGVKSHLRNGRPVILGISTNDALSGNAPNIGSLLLRKNYYFIPMRQDDPLKKPCSIVADFEQLDEAVAAALEGRQLQPLLLAPAAMP